MSRAYDMYVQVTGFQPERLDALKAAATDIWNFEWFTDSPTLLDGFGESQLCGGETEDQFAERLAKAIWSANGAFCPVQVTATYMENLPHEDYEFDEEDFQRLQTQTTTPTDSP